MNKIVPLSDLHVGSLWGLWPPRFEAEDPRTGRTLQFVQNDTQRKLWKHWQKMVSTIDPDTIILNGDLIDGAQPREGGRGLVTPNIEWQVAACLQVLETLPKVPTYCTMGTGYHSMPDGSAAEQWISKQMGYEFGDELIVEECGIRLFCRHVIGASNTAWQYMTTAPARDQMLLYLNKSAEKYGPIDYAVFSHRHQFVHTEFTSGSAIVTPCWQTKTPYAVKKGIITTPDIGWVELNILDKKNIAVDKRGIEHIERPCKVVGRDRIKQIRGKPK
jgi:hypothetical protein